MPRPPNRKVRPSTLRVIAGEMRGRKILYHGDPATRPMRDSVREALFNILSTTVVDALCWDFFAGTGALSVESLSRGAYRAMLIELDRSAADTIRQSLAALNLTGRSELITGDAFRIAPRLLAAGDTSRRWIVFICRRTNSLKNVPKRSSGSSNWHSKQHPQAARSSLKWTNIGPPSNCPLPNGTSANTAQLASDLQRSQLRHLATSYAPIVSRFPVHRERSHQSRLQVQTQT